MFVDIMIRYAIYSPPIHNDLWKGLIMWQLWQQKKELISVSFSYQSLTCAWIQKKKSNVPFQLRAYKRIAFDDTYHAHNMLFNPSKVKKFILHFLVAHKQCNAYVSFCTINSAMSEQYISLQTTDSQSHEFGMKNTSIVTWKYQHLYQHDGQSIFYAYGIPRSLVLQYQLLAVNTHLNLIAIRTPHSALFTLYTFLYGVAFRKTQYALDMIKNENQPERLISMEMIRRTIALPIGFPLKEESRHIAIACGLCIAAEEES